jgi:hypothetical protein
MEWGLSHIVASLGVEIQEKRKDTEEAVLDAVVMVGLYILLVILLKFF